MVEVTIKGEEYSVKGTFDFGYIGLFKDDDIELYDFKDIISKRKGRWWDKAVEALGIKGTSDEEISEALTTYINNFEAKIQKNIKEINNNLIAKMAEQWENCGTPFWEASDELFISERMQEFEEIQKTDDFEDTISSIVADYIDEPNNGTMEKIDAEAEMRRLFPIFDWDKFLNNMKPKCVSPKYNGNFGFEFYDGFGAGIFCSAVAELDDELRFLRWDNM